MTDVYAFERCPFRDAAHAVADRSSIVRHAAHALWPAARRAERVELSDEGIDGVDADGTHALAWADVTDVRSERAPLGRRTLRIDGAAGASTSRRSCPASTSSSAACAPLAHRTRAGVAAAPAGRPAGAPARGSEYPRARRGRPGRTARGAGYGAARCGAPLPLASDRRSLALFALTLGVFLVTLNVTVVVVALPSLQADLHIRPDEAAWVIDAYNLVGASLLLSAGFFADRFGRRRAAVRRLCALRDRRARVHAGAERRLADRVQGADGGRRDGAHADEPLDRREPLSGAARAGARDRPLGHLVGHRDGARADRRRRAHRLARLALGVRGECASRAWSRWRSCCGSCRARAARSRVASTLPDRCS